MIVGYKYIGMRAIVLARRDFRENDQVITVYTTERGKLDLVARGIKKIIAKNSAHLEPFSFVDIDITIGKEADYVTKVHPVDFFVPIRSDLNKSLMSQYLLSLVSKLLNVGEEDKRIFDLLISWFRFVNSTEFSGVILLDAFVMQFFALLGFQPALEACVVCDRSYKSMMKADIKGKHKPGFYFSGGGLVCEDCKLQKRSIGEQIIDCGLREVSDMQMLLQADWRTVVEFAMEDSTYQKLHKLVYEFVVYHSEKEIGDWEFRF
ncbi:MAG: DNA repair protein RecO [Candidatus Magasanikbacteria bacterium CG_4_10_14_0_2_um_filter_37_12]|uniref:DNA repair protein RecO n=1 Tax=Candidatus Magasanikbacteria bacterium CG_4_10_14_0_2_um_filter_37_12 TaxID=1974637 RepID=A0A2M7V8J4_9BACT|nr:MAG: DNA repair protein RecO [Candidatus Magasanikbacteria bacterium CG_4_10_14_0_2_um_filter_37_12]